MWLPIASVFCLSNTKGVQVSAFLGIVNSQVPIGNWNTTPVYWRCNGVGGIPQLFAPLTYTINSPLVKVTMAEKEVNN